MRDISRPDRVEPLANHHASLAFGVPDSAPGTIYALSVSGGVRLSAGEERAVVFGRNRPDVDVCVGEDDLRISRSQGAVTYRAGLWWLTNTGHRALQLPHSLMLFPEDDPHPVDPGYTPVFVSGTARRQHLLELYVTGDDGRRPRPAPNSATLRDKPWALSSDERLALVSLAQKYLLHEAYPQPCTWQQVAADLSGMQPSQQWTSKRAEHLVAGVRRRLSRGGVPGLTREEVGEPVGNMLNHNLVMELLQTRTLVPPDLLLLDDI
ncbi:hypothetical protein [Promicromonospora sp. NPDC057488]|uniref:hypothetical protein n=1 Tax=Promicromonospora sp. NPDC057488 TaxID=3346147 RepID=UPI00366CF1DF